MSSTASTQGNSSQLRSPQSWSTWSQGSRRTLFAQGTECNLRLLLSRYCPCMFPSDTETERRRKFRRGSNAL